MRRAESFCRCGIVRKWARGAGLSSKGDEQTLEDRPLSFKVATSINLASNFVVVHRPLLLLFDFP